MFTASRLRRIAPLAVLLAVTSLVAACSSDLTGPGGKRRSGYITTSAAVQPMSAKSSGGSSSSGTSSGTTSTGTTSTDTSTRSGTKKAGDGDRNSSSGYNVPAL